LDTIDLEAAAEQQEVCNEEEEVGTVGALEDQYGVFLAVGGCQQAKIVTWADGGSWKKVSAARGWLTHRAVPAVQKGRIRRGPGKTAGSCTRGQSRRLELHLCSKKMFLRPLDKLMSWRL
jgi:hypothetical protein